jgi:hypothetical protein
MHARRPALPILAALALSCSVPLLALTAGYPATSAWSIGLGPALYVCHGVNELAGSAAQRTRALKLGLLAEAGLRLPSHTRWFCDMTLQYRIVGRARIGPFNSGVVTSDTVVLPATSPRFDHLFVGIGLGRRH